MFAKFKQLAVFSLLNLPISWLIAWRYLEQADIASFSAGSYLALVFAGHIGFVLLLAFLPIALLGAMLPKKLAMVVAVLLMAVVQLGLLLDTYIFSLYRFHLSGFVLELLLTGGGDVFQFSLKAWLTLLALISVALGIEWLLWLLAGRLPKLKRYAQAFALGCVALLSANLWHAWADANYHTDIPNYTRYFPAYYPLTAKRQMAKLGLTDPQAIRDQIEWKRTDSTANLNYPTAPLQCQTATPPDNLLIILVDTLRADMLTAELMPNLYRFAQTPNSFALPEHLSGGNSTKAGVFSLFYGLPVSYWDAFTAAQRPPVLMQKLKEQGYDFKIFSSATLVSPAFDRNIFAGLDKVELYSAGGTPWQRDRTVTDKWNDWLAQREGEQPFFGFLFLDAVHGYSTPADFPRIEPYWESINHIELGPNFDRTPYFNRYKTAVRYVDGLIGEVLAGLESQGVLENTVVLITSDHGESFNEHGKNFWGHGSNYSMEQVQVPVVMHWPSLPAQPVARRTSHADLPVTLMESLFACQAPHYAYSLGDSIFKPASNDWIVSGSYLGEAVLFPDFYVDIPLSGHPSHYDYQLNAVPLQVPSSESLEVMRAFSRFYR